MNNAFFSIALVLFALSLVNCANSPNEPTRSDITSETQNKTAAAPVKVENAEEKAVRVAEEFIRRNGYTTAPADKNNLAHETVEYYDGIDDLLKQRYNTLEAKAYGVSPHGYGNQKGWTVVFRYTEKVIREIERTADGRLAANPRVTGRAVTMDVNFENLRVQHKGFFLDKADKKF